MIEDTSLWSIITGLGLLATGVLAYFASALGKTLSVREHEEFKTAISRSFTEWARRFERDCDRLEQDIRLLQSTRPTAGELQAAMDAVKARIASLEMLVKRNGH